jgi:hypothetical protein
MKEMKEKLSKKYFGFSILDIFFVHFLKKPKDFGKI